MAKIGGKRSGAGRKPGSRNKTTIEAKATLAELAQGYADEAMMALHSIATTGQSEAARVSASVAILDRAYGKPIQIQQVETPKDPDAPYDPVELARRFLFVMAQADHQLKQRGEEQFT